MKRIGWILAMQILFSLSGCEWFDSDDSEEVSNPRIVSEEKTQSNKARIEPVRPQKPVITCEDAIHTFGKNFLDSINDGTRVIGATMLDKIRGNIQKQCDRNKELASCIVRQNSLESLSKNCSIE